MRIVIGSDHAGYELKEFLIERLERDGHTVHDVGTYSTDPVDYPDFAKLVAEQVITAQAQRGIMVGGSGEGEAIAPNKFPGIRAVLCHDTYTARMGMEHNDSNLLAMGARVIGPELAWEVVHAWLGSSFTSIERHAHRLATIAAWEKDRRFPLRELARQGQSVWFDYIRRSLLTSGEFRRLLADGVVGVTSNPTIFEKAISGSSDYEESLRDLVSQGKKDEDIFQSLALADIRMAAEQLHPIYDLTEGRDGYVSLELPPALANDTQGSITAARRLWRALNVDNVMLKVPGTAAGVPVVEELIYEGIKVNITLLFSQESYEAVANAYIRALERRAAEGKSVEGAASVASFFVSRMDTSVDAQLEEKIRASSDPTEKTELEGLLGKAAIANAKLAYQRYKELFSGPRWAALASKGASTQRLLWGSTGAKNPNYRDVRYVEELIGPDTINTVPPATLTAFMDHGYVRPSLQENLQEARAVMAGLARHGIDLKTVTDKLLEDGIELFAESYRALLKSISAKRDELIKGETRRRSASLGSLESAVEETLSGLRHDHIARRMWHFDTSLWKAGDPDHARVIANRLGWLTVADEMQEHLGVLTGFVQEVRDAGFTHAVLLGMGGSSLAPEVLRRTFGVAQGYLDLSVLDTTDPVAILELERSLPLERTLFIVSSKSGTTTESLSFYRYFWERLKERIGADPGGNFIAITDPGTPLEETGRAQGFRRVFLNPPDIGGRYSALSYFGLVPAALIGMDVAGLLDRADRMIHACMPGVPFGDNPGVWLGAVMSALAKQGRDKVTLLLSPGIVTLGYWVEQLLAESTGKEGVGLIPVEGEAVGLPEVYGEDRLFVYLRLDSDPEGDLDQRVAALAAEYPVVTFHLRDSLDIGGEFFRWEFATAVAGAVLGIDPFDEPNVQESKDSTSRVLAALQNASDAERVLEPTQPTRVDGLAVYGDLPAQAGVNPLAGFLALGQPGDYVAIMAYVTPNQANYGELSTLRRLLQEELRLATTLGFGPRFLHSTGQLHKGGPNRGLFIQITDDDDEDMRVPGQHHTFGMLKRAQALGDFRALQQHGCRVIRIHAGSDVKRAVVMVEQAVGGPARSHETWR